MNEANGVSNGQQTVFVVSIAETTVICKYVYCCGGITVDVMHSRKTETACINKSISPCSIATQLKLMLE